ncbi:MAG: methylglyoxal synthase, partial [Rikenellaceae bacterium]
GALIAEDKIDMVIFLCDPMTSQPHDVDVKALIRLSSVYNVPMALNLSTADYIISSELFEKDYTRKVKDYSTYIERTLKSKPSYPIEISPTSRAFKLMVL